MLTVMRSCRMDIERSWSDFRSRPFPDDWVGEEIDGICVTSVDSFAAGCIDTFLSNGRTLESGRIEILHRCSTELRRILPQLDGQARDYFGHLDDLVTGVLNEVEH